MAACPKTAVIYYNENDPKAAAWLQALIDAREIGFGVVDKRSICDVQPNELSGFDQHHFFAGIGGWPLALRIAGWPDDKPVATGSCPCQPFSTAGKRKGVADSRHLWPQFFRLIQERKFPVVFGEQVASKDGRIWLAGVRADLENVGYAVGAADLCAAGVGAPNIRQRLYWVADSNVSSDNQRPPSGKQPICDRVRQSVDRLEHTKSERLPRRPDNRDRGRRECASGPAGEDATARLGHSTGQGLQEQRSEYRPGGEGCGGFVGFAVQVGVPEWNGRTVALECQDGYRRASAQSGAFPVAYGLPKRMGRLRGYGNAINPYLAAQFIQASEEARLCIE